MVNEKYGVEKMENGYTFSAWQGTNSHKFLYGSELAKAIRQAFKECKIKGCTVSSKTYSGGQSITISITPKQSDFIPYAVFENKCFECINYMRFGDWLYDENNKAYHYDVVYSLPQEQAHHLYKLAIKRHYQRYIEGCTLNEYHFEKLEVFTEEFKKKLLDIRQVVLSFNHDDSDCMTDYFDRGFYEHYNLKPVKG